uniref:Uncharacterized protein n=1 Tax=Kuenenia stuttgartiensis TaxID=174633 RepID=Q1PUR7_KUEST|nr:unknown protein [Candidatus Kuenenia stuttgartiensis]
MSNYNFQKTEGTKQLIKIHNGKMLQHKFTNTHLYSADKSGSIECQIYSAKQ